MISLDFQLDWKPNFQFAGVIYAHHQGWYERAGIDLRLLPWQGLTNPADALKKEGRVIASAEENLLIKARSDGVPIRAIGTMLQFSPIGWMALKETEIAQMPDLKGKRLGIHADGKMAVETALAHFGMSKGDIEIVEIGYEYGDLLKSGQCAAVQCLVMVEPLELKEEGFDLNVMPAYSWGYESYCQILAVRERFLEEARALLEDFLGITFEGWRAALEDIPAVSGWIAAEYLTEAKVAMEAEMLEAYRPFLSGKVGLQRIGWMESERWEQSIQMMVKNGMIPAPVRVAEVMTNELVESIYQGATS